MFACGVYYIHFQSRVIPYVIRDYTDFLTDFSPFMLSNFYYVNSCSCRQNCRQEKILLMKKLFLL